MPFIVMDAIFYAMQGSSEEELSNKYQLATPLLASREAESVLKKLRVAINAGYDQRVLQRTPHLVVLNRDFYRKHIMPLLAQWLVLWLSLLKKSGMFLIVCGGWLVVGY